MTLCDGSCQSWQGCGCMNKLLIFCASRLVFALALASHNSICLFACCVWFVLAPCTHVVPLQSHNCVWWLMWGHAWANKLMFFLQFPFGLCSHDLALPSHKSIHLFEHCVWWFPSFKCSAFAWRKLPTFECYRLIIGNITLLFTKSGRNIPILALSNESYPSAQRLEGCRTW